MAKPRIKPVLVLNGPNLNMLGKRQPKIYGKKTLADLNEHCQQVAAELGMAIDCRQSNLEGELVSWIQEARTKHSAIVINAGGYSHSSVAILDALILSELPVVEVHISNIHAREEFRHKSLISQAAKGVICGFGFEGYTYALDAAYNLITASN